MNFSRRGFLRIGMALGAAKALRMPALVPQAPGESLFLEVSSSSCGIEWVHENAMSDNRYLPETLGPGCAWFDFDNDGLLDLFVCSFVDYGAKQKLACGDNQLGNHYYCIPRVFRGTSSFLYHNNGDGTFSEVSKGTDIARGIGKGLGVVATDINNDGRMDLFVANDTVQNFLFVNRGPNKWEEMAMAAEVGFSENGQARSGMGVDSADFDEDGWQDLFVANVDQEMFSLYKNNKNESFSDVAQKQGIAQPTRLLSGWGLKFFDYDNDGALDL